VQPWSGAPAATGLAVLAAAGIGAVLVHPAGAGPSVADESVSLRSQPSAVAPDGLFVAEAATENAGGTDSRFLAARRDDAAGQVSRGTDRSGLQQQAEVQARQRIQALSRLTDRAEERADELAAAQWVVPVSGYDLTAGFGETSSLWSTMHTGLDFAAREGAPVVSVTTGTVTSTRYDGAYGNTTVVTLEDGTEVWYCHLSAQSAQRGQVVAPGEPIGAVGSTGNVTGPHLHLEIRPDGRKPVDPFTTLAANGARP